MRPDFRLLFPSSGVEVGTTESVRAEIHDGVHLDRRTVLQFAALGGGVGLSGSRGEARASSSSMGPLDFDAFVDEMFGLSEQAVGASAPNQDAYLYAVASLMTRVTGVPQVEAAPFGDLQGLRVGRHARRMPISVLELRLEPNAVIPLHNHNGYAGNLVGLDGELRISSYEPVGALASPTPTEPFLLRETSRVLMTPGRVATLATDRDNFHTLVAGPNGARALDVFTFFEEPGRSGYFEVDDEPRDAALRIFEARPR